MIADRNGRRFRALRAGWRWFALRPHTSSVARSALPAAETPSLIGLLFTDHYGVWSAAHFESDPSVLGPYTILLICAACHTRIDICRCHFVMFPCSCGDLRFVSGSAAASHRRIDVAAPSPIVAVDRDGLVGCPTRSAVCEEGAHRTWDVIPLGIDQQTKAPHRTPSRAPGTSSGRPCRRP
jgi:hypothetical protein